MQCVSFRVCAWGVWGCGWWVCGCVGGVGVGGGVVYLSGVVGDGGEGGWGGSGGSLGVGWGWLLGVVWGWLGVGCGGGGGGVGGMGFSCCGGQYICADQNGSIFPGSGILSGGFLKVLCIKRVKIYELPFIDKYLNGSFFHPHVTVGIQMSHYLPTKHLHIVDHYHLN